MKPKSHIVFLAISLLISLNVLAQKGFVRGNVADGEYGGPMIGAAITLANNPGVGTITDFDGNYSLSLEPGTYTIQVSFLSYVTQKFENIVVKAGEATIIDATMKTNVEQLEAVEIIAEVARNTETAILMDMKKSTNVMDGLSAQTFRKVGDGDLSGAIKRVTGVTVQGGKYVYVRGLGDRYSRTTLNGMNIPGMDPDVNAVQIDIFPTSVLENVAVYKTFSPDLYGDFTGGLVDVVTKSFPDQKQTQIGVGVTFIPGMHFNSDFFLYDGGNLDWFGYDDGARAIPISPFKRIPDPVLSNPELTEITSAFNPQLAVQGRTSLPNGSFSFATGNQINRESGATIGYNAVFNYSNENTFYEDFESNDYLKNNNLEQDELQAQVFRRGDVARNNVMWSGLLTGSYKKKNNSYTVTLLNSQNGEASASKRINRDVEQNVAVLDEDVLTYTARTLSTLGVNGKHKFGGLEWTWANATSYSRVYDPDFRETRISIGSVENPSPALSTGDGAGILRFWRDLNEYNQSVRTDVKYAFSERFELKGGATATLKWRSFETYSFTHTRDNKNNIEQDADWFLADENIWRIDNSQPRQEWGTYTIGNFQPVNQFDARQNNYAAYARAEQSVGGLFKFIYGVRLESAQMFYTGQNRAGEVFNDQKTLDELNLLPSLNVVYTVNEDMNVRIGANRTVARPSFKEKSGAEIYDPITKRTFVGNIDLEQTFINNFDFRYEYFLSPKELFSVALFYKQFDGHIELVSFNTAPDNFQPRNSGLAQVYGAEFELRKALSNGENFLSRFFFGGNFSLVQSGVDLSSVIVNPQSGLTEKELREANARSDEKIGNTRPMAGQSPYAINGSLIYEVSEKQFNVALAYNVQGEQLTIISSGRVPDVYTIPFHTLDFNAYKGFGENFKHRITLSLNNILNDDRTLVYRSHQADDQIYTSFRPGVGIGLKYNYTF